MIDIILILIACTCITISMAVPATITSTMTRHCSREEAHSIALLYAYYKFDYSDCPSEFWLEALRHDAERQNDTRSKVLMYIGFNKGYFMMHWLNTWMDSYSTSRSANTGKGSSAKANSIETGRSSDTGAISGSMWMNAITKAQGGPHDTVADCGVCGDCNRPLRAPEPPLRQSFNTTIVGIDLNKYNIDLLTNISKQFPHLLPSQFSTSGVNLYLEHAAVSSTNGVVSVDNSRGSSYEGLAIRPGRENDTEFQDYIVVRQVTVDTLVDELLHRGWLASSTSLLAATSDHSMTRSSRNHAVTINNDRKSAIHPNMAKLFPPLIDLLMIDVEGFEPLVFQGARKLLRRREARIIIFEYHNVCPWPIYLLKTTLWHIERWEYACYFMSKHRRLWRISGCWDPIYEHHQWSNVLCVYRNDPWYRVIDSFRVTAAAAAQDKNAASVTQMPLPVYKKYTCPTEYTKRSAGTSATAH